MRLHFTLVYSTYRAYIIETYTYYRRTMYIEIITRNSNDRYYKRPIFRCFVHNKRAYVQAIYSIFILYIETIMIDIRPPNHTHYIICTNVFQHRDHQKQRLTSETLFEPQLIYTYRYIDTYIDTWIHTYHSIL